MDTYSAVDRSPTAGREDATRPYDGYRRRSPGKISFLVDGNIKHQMKSNFFETSTFTHMTCLSVGLQKLRFGETTATWSGKIKITNKHRQISTRSRKR